MKILILTLALAIICAPAISGQTTSPGTGKSVSEEQELKALDRAWHDAVAARDEGALTRLLADDYHINLDMKRMLTKAQENEAVRASDPLYAFGSFKLKDVTVRIEGERASVSGILTIKPQNGDKNSRRRYFYTRTFSRKDGRWQILACRLVTLSSDVS
jgi:ketosteroid isomerase-like protein